MDAGCTVNKKRQCLAQQAKLGTQSQSSVSTQAHKLIYVDLKGPRFLVGPLLFDATRSEDCFHSSSFDKLQE